MAKRQLGARRASLVEILTARIASDILYDFSRADVLSELSRPTSARRLARRFGLHPHATSMVLEYLARTTDVVIRRGTRYALGRNTDLRSVRSLLAKYAGAYAPTSRSAVAHLRSPESGSKSVDMRALARAYESDRESVFVIELIRQLAPAGFLDIGCGRATVLARVCIDTPTRGWGVDPSITMCRAARSTIREAGLQRRVAIRRGTLEEIGNVINAEERSRVSLIHCASTFNALFSTETRVVDSLRFLSAQFPGRLLVIVDYLSALDSPLHPGLRTYLTDVTQLLSGQGLPPSTHRGWVKLYRRAACDLVNAFEGNADGLRWFVHLVRLSPRRR